MSAKRCALNLTGKLFTIYQRRPIAHGTPSFAKKNRRPKPKTVMPNNDQRRYGFFTCPKCKRDWESSWAWCYRGTDNPSSGQECQTCNIMVKPHTVERLKCSLCGLTTDLCDCDREDRHNDPKKPHRSDLCERCKRGQRCSSSRR